MKFFLGLWAAKLYIFISKVLGNKKDDKAGLLSFRFCSDFLSKLSKPQMLIAVTGTNGKTTVVNLLAEMLKKENKRILYNDWGANTKAGMARCLIDGVTIFNKPKKKVTAVLEVDEVTSGETLPQMKPNYMIVTNLFRDSMHRNANPDYVFSKLYKGIPKETILILNADDAFSCELSNKVNKTIYYSINEMKTDKKNGNNIVNDFILCPKCNTNLEYDYIRYHHIGKVHCPKCGFKSKQANYAADLDIENNEMTINKVEKYSLLNDSIFNAYNLLAVIVCLEELGYSTDTIKENLKNQKIVNSRLSLTKIKNIEVGTIATKGLNAVAVSRVCEYVSKLDGNIELIIVIDDTFDNKNGSEAIAWIYDVDFEFLNKENIKRIIIGGVRSSDYKLRLLLAGISEKKIFICKDEYDTVNYLEYKNINKILILHEVYLINGSKKIKQSIIDKIESGKSL